MLFCIIIFCEIIKPSYQIVYSCNSNVSCGCSRNPVVLTKVVGGEPASTATWGWAVSISIYGRYLCGGSILSSSWVITAAHCVKSFNASQITIYAGSNIRWTGTQTRVISHVCIHPNYTSNSYTHDIALLHLISPLMIDDPNLNSICLGHINSVVLMTKEWPPVNTTVVAVGWGALSEGGSLPMTLQQVTLQIIDRQDSTCSKVLQNWKFQLCASVPDGSKDTCYGDSGGPLMMFTSNRQWVLIGLTSNGVGCADAAYSGVYTRVAAYEHWINSTINDFYLTSRGSCKSISQMISNQLICFILSIIVNILFC